MAADRTCDAVVVGAGHNGLVTAAYLAKAGLRTLVCERRHVVGGAAVTEELISGFRLSTASYSLSLLRPDIHAELDLTRHGLVILPKDPQLFVPLPDGRSFFVWRDAARTRAELEAVHAPDADGYARWSAFWDEAVRLLRPLVEDPAPPGPDGVRDRLVAAGREDVWTLAVAGSAAACVETFFEAPEVQGAFVGQGIIGTAAGVRDSGTAWVMAYHAIGGELVGMDGTWAYVRGGMGSVTAALAAAAREAGAVIAVNAPVSEVLVSDGRATGVRLADGSVVRAGIVASNADPVTSFLRLVPSGTLPPAFADRVRGWRTPGSVVKVNLALDGLPEFRSRPGPGPQHAGTIELAPSVDHVQQAWDDARAGRPSREPFMEVFIQSAVDDTLAPPGKHVLSAFAQYAPQDADPAERDTLRDEAAEAVMRVLEDRAPGIRDLVLARDVLDPAELESRLGLAGGNIFHGEILPEQSFGARFDYATPLPGLYLCGSGARPGGGVMGAPGRNAARAILAARRG